MLSDTDPKADFAGIGDANTCPHSNLDTYIGSVHFTRGSSASEGIDHESSDSETGYSEERYDVEGS